MKEWPRVPAWAQEAEVQSELTCLSILGSHTGCRGEAGGFRESRAGQGEPWGWTRWKSLDFVFNVKGQSLEGFGQEV